MQRPHRDMILVPAARRPTMPQPTSSHQRRRETRCHIELLEVRNLPAMGPLPQFLVDSTDLYSVSGNASDLGSPAVFLYTDYQAGGTYGAVNDASGVDLDGNDPDAGRGPSSFRMTATGPNGYFQFGIGETVANRPRDIAEFGKAHTLRFLAKGEADNQLLRVNVFRTLEGGGFEQVASSDYLLSTGWADHSLSLPANLTPADLHAVQFVLPSAGAIRLDEVRIDTDGFDPLRVVQSYRPAGWAPSGSPLNTPAGRDLAIYPNRSFLYDVALAAKALLIGSDAAGRRVALDNIEAVLGTSPNGANGYFNQRNSGHALLGDGSPRDPFSQQRTLGDNSWFGMALLDAYCLTGDARYLIRARELSDWAEATLKAPGPLGGYRGGFDADGNLLPWRATEHNIDYFQLNRLLAETLSGLGDPAAPAYAGRATYAGDFVMAMFDDDEGKFWTGTGVGDAINTDSAPLDAQTWSVLTLGQSAQYGAAIDWSRPILWAESVLIRSDDGFTGFTYSSQSTPARVWFEGVAQGAIVYQIQGNAAQAQQSLQTLDQAVLGSGGVRAASGDSLEDPFLGALYDRREAAAATAWSCLAHAERNPFDLFSQRKFDFNAKKSPTATGYAGVQAGDLFTVARGYGWIKKAKAFDNKHLAADPLLRDGHRGKDGTFRILLEAGSVCTVTLRCGDGKAHAGIDVDAEGLRQIDNLVIAKKSIVVRTFTVTVGPDGVLDIRFHDDGGKDRFAIDAIEVCATKTASPPASQPARSATETGRLDAYYAWIGRQDDSTYVPRLAAATARPRGCGYRMRLA